MSIRIMTAVFEKSKTRQSARLVLLSLADNASDEGVCFPAVATIAKKAGITDQVAREYLHAFEKIGLIHITERADGDRQTSNLYKINEKKIGNDAITKDIMAEVRPPSRVRPLLHSKTLPPMTESDPPPLTRVRDESSVNHHKEPLRKPKPRNPVFDAIASVCSPSDPTLKAEYLKANGSWIAKVANNGAGHFAPEKIGEWFGEGGWWYSVHCKGMAEIPKPNPTTIQKNIALAAEWDKTHKVIKPQAIKYI